MIIIIILDLTRNRNDTRILVYGIACAYVCINEFVFSGHPAVALSRTDVRDEKKKKLVYMYTLVRTPRGRRTEYIFRSFDIEH